MATVDFDTNLNTQCKSEDQVDKFIKCKTESKLQHSLQEQGEEVQSTELTFSGAVSSELLETAEALLGRGRQTHQQVSTTGLAA